MYPHEFVWERFSAQDIWTFDVDLISRLISRFSLLMIYLPQSAILSSGLSAGAIVTVGHFAAHNVRDLPLVHASSHGSGRGLKINRRKAFQVHLEKDGLGNGFGLCLRDPGQLAVCCAVVYMASATISSYKRPDFAALHQFILFWGQFDRCVLRIN